jgi:hypothetical protein
MIKQGFRVRVLSHAPRNDACNIGRCQARLAHAPADFTSVLWYFSQNGKDACVVVEPGIGRSLAIAAARQGMRWSGEASMNRSFGFRVESAKYGVGFGSALAIAISYTSNHSILWAIIDGILGWIYVIYFALFRS